MAVTVRELVTKWSINVDDSAMKRAEQSVSDLKSGLKALAALGVAAGGTLFGIAKSVADIGDSAAKTAKTLGLSAASLQELGFAAQIGGSSQEEISAALRKFARTLAEAEEGVETYKDALDQIGLSTDVLSDKTLKTDDIFMIAADRIAAMPDGFRKTAVAQELFGRAGAKLIPMLNEGSAGIKKLRDEAVSLGIVLGKDDTDAAEEFQDALLRAKSAVLGIRNAIGSRLMPIFIRLFDRFKKFVLINREFIMMKMNKFFDSLVKTMKALWSIIRMVSTVVLGLTKMVGGLNNAIKILLALTVSFIALKFAAALGNAAIAIYQLATAFRFAGNTALIAQAKMLAFPILIGLAIVGLILIIEDLYSYFDGRDSLFGRAIKGAMKFAKSVGDIFSTIGGRISKGFSRVFGDWWAEVKRVFWDRNSSQSDRLVNSLKLLVKTLALPFKLLGVIIGEGILGGMVEGIRKNFPKLAGFLGLALPDGMKSAPVNKELDQEQRRQTTLSVLNAAQRSVQTGIDTAPVGGGIISAPVIQGAPRSAINMNNNITINGSGLDEAALQRSIQGALDSTARETLRAASQPAG